MATDQCVDLQYQEGVNGGPDWWVKGKARRGCITAPTREGAMALFAEYTGDTAESADVLPYPAAPRLNCVWYEYPADSQYAGKKCCTPSFCISPESCKGHSACPRNYSCTE
jgi:hypothetical protein